LKIFKTVITEPTVKIFGS